MAAASLKNIEGWYQSGIVRGATHMLVVTDTWTMVDTPIFVLRWDDVNEVIAKYLKMEHTKIQEVYNLSMLWAEQNTPREKVWNI